MNDFFRESLFAGVTLSLLSYFIGSVLKKKFKLGIMDIIKIIKNCKWNLQKFITAEIIKII